jgi:hypothetical protein
MSGTNVTNPNILVPLQVNYVNHNNQMNHNNHNGHGHMMNQNINFQNPNFQNKINTFIPNRFPNQQHQHIQPIQTQTTIMQQQQRKMGMFPDQSNQINDPNQQQAIPIVGSNL